MPDQPTDLLVIGGGINGAGIAREAARRGLSVILVESHRFGEGTSSKSSMLAHGGLRYLEQFEFRLVHEALQDRERMFQEFPDLVKPLRFLYPIYPEVAARRTVRVGLMLYDWLSHGRSVPGREWLKRAEVPRLAPGIKTDGLKGGATYYDGQIEDVPALVRRLIEQARAAGADCREGAHCDSLLIEEGRCVGAVIDGQPLKARSVVNAAGPWVDTAIAQLGRKDPLLRLTKGTHLVVPRFLDVAVIVKAASDGRTFFILPWKDHCLVGTTDTDYQGDPRDAEATADDVAYLQAAVRDYFPDAPVDEIAWTYAGVRPLLHEPGLGPSHVTRRHRLFDHTDDGAAGLWSLQGGKLTTFISFGEMVVAAVEKHLRAT